MSKPDLNKKQRRLCNLMVPQTAMFVIAFAFSSRCLAIEDPDQTDVFVAGKDGYHTYRIPSLVTAANGNLLAICEGRKDNRSDHGNIDLIVKRSTDDGNTWGETEIIYEEGGDKKITIGNPCPVVDRDTGTIWMTFCKDNDQVLVVSSKDNGTTWSKPSDITEDVKPEGWGWYATGPGVGIQIKSGKYKGRLVIPCDHRERNDGKWIKMSHVFYSDDHGKSWSLGGTVADHTDECQVVELADGRLMINMRNYWGRDGNRSALGGKRAVSFSDDGGATWSELLFDESLIEPVCQASIHRFEAEQSDQPVYLFSNPASNSTRQSLTIRLSRDGGKTWPVSRVLHDGPAAYSCLYSLSDGSIGCLYERGNSDPYEKLTFAKFRLNWLNN